MVKAASARGLVVRDDERARRRAGPGELKGDPLRRVDLLKMLALRQAAPPTGAQGGRAITPFPGLPLRAKRVMPGVSSARP